MTLDPKRQQELDEAMVEGLLPEALGSNDENRRRIDTFFSATLPQHLRQQSSRPAWIAKLPSALVAALAATLLLAVSYGLGLWGNDPARQARAAVIRCMEANGQAREYRIEMLRRNLLGGERTATATLYVEAEQFLVRHPGWGLGKEFWVGGNATERWIVGANGPALVGGEPMIDKALARKEVEESSYLHITTLLRRMSKIYQLEMLPDETLVGPFEPTAEVSGEPQAATERQTQMYQRIRGTLTKPRRLPHTIDLWIDRDSGVARRLTMQWHRSRGPGMLNSSIDLVGTPDLPSDWFDIKARLQPEQRVIRVQRDTDFEQVSNSGIDD